MDSLTLFIVFLVLIIVMSLLLAYALKSGNVDPSELSFQDNGIGSILEEFYRQKNNQAKIAFNFSIASASAGFLLFIYALLRFFITNGNTDNIESWISVVSGSITEVIAALFFSIQKRADKELQKNIDGLRVHALLNELTDDDLKNRSRIQVINYLTKNISDETTDETHLPDNEGESSK